MSSYRAGHIPTEQEASKARDPGMLADEVEYGGFPIPTTGATGWQAGYWTSGPR